MHNDGIPIYPGADNKELEAYKAKAEQKRKEERLKKTKAIEKEISKKIIGDKLTCPKHNKEMIMSYADKITLPKETVLLNYHCDAGCKFTTDLEV